MSESLHGSSHETLHESLHKNHIACMKVHIVGTNLESFRTFAVSFIRENFALNLHLKLVCSLF